MALPTQDPVKVQRLQPSLTSFFLKNGFRSLITFLSNPSIRLWEKSVTPPGLDGGEMVPLGSVSSDKFQLFTPQDLVRVTEARALVAYSPAAINDIISIINKRDDIVTFTFPNSTYWSVRGGLIKFIPNELTDGVQPTASITIGIRSMEDTQAKIGDTDSFTYERSIIYDGTSF